MHTQGEQIEKLLNSIEAFTTADLERPAWGEISFREAEEVLREIHELTGMLAALPTKYLSEKSVRLLLNALSSVSNVLGLIRNFSIQDRPRESQRQLIQQLTNSLEELVTVCEPIVPFLALFREGLSGVFSEAAKLSITSADKLNSQLQEVELKTEEFDRLIDAARARASKEGVAEFAVGFNEERKARDSEAKLWLRWAVFFAAASVAVPLIFWFLIPLPPQGGAALVQYISTKVVVLAIFVAATTWCAGNYRAARHLATVNAHKANSLTSFLTFVRSTDDRVTRDQVLLETTRSIFAQPPTGFLKGETHADQPSRMVEVIKASSGS